MELQHNVIQSIWLRGSYQNTKKVYFCHGYREHQSSMGSSINDQKKYLDVFLQQWEEAVNHGLPTEPNEVHVSLGMNLDYLKENWLQSTYRLCSLTKMVESVCNENNFSQIVREPTRSMYNSLSAKFETSCIDHIYTNAKQKCSSADIIVTGLSDHNLVGFTRYSKTPPAHGRVIVRRSYKGFVSDDFLVDLKSFDWTWVY